MEKETNKQQSTEPKARAKYETLSIKAMSVFPQGILCGSGASGGGPLGLMSSPYNGGGTL